MVKDTETIFTLINLACTQVLLKWKISKWNTIVNPERFKEIVFGSLGVRYKREKRNGSMDKDKYE